MMQRTPSSAKAKTANGSSARERHRLLLGLALLLTVFAEVSPMGQFGGVSTTITSNNDPSALQQLATFAALAEVAEEEDLDWGSLTRLDRHTAAQRGAGPGRRATSTPPRIDPTTTATTNDAAALPSTRGAQCDASDDGQDSSIADTDSASPTGSGTSSAGSLSSRRRPHRRQHRRKGVSVVGSEDGSGSTSNSPSESGYGPSSAASSMATVPKDSVHNHRIWSQFHVMEVAYSTRSNNFIHVTERFAEYERMYPIVYQCSLGNVASPAEAELLATPSTGLAASRQWTCERCGRRHDVVRESCQRCRAPSHFAKLFVGQAVKEVSCAPSLIRLLYATHPDIPLHRVECHTDQSGRGKGCAALYVDRHHAAELIEKLDRNVFYDVDSTTGELMAHYVYTQQRGWLAALAAERVENRQQCNLHATDSTIPLPPSGVPLGCLPLNPLVVEESKAPPHPRDPRQRGAAQETTFPARRGNGEFHQEPATATMMFAL